MSYRSILDRADAFFRSVMEAQPENLRCGRGCSFCCYGLFAIGSADIPILAEGLSALHSSRRQMIVRRAAGIIAETRHPDLRESTPREKDAFFDRTASVACPNLDESGSCMIYDHRPLICRTFGLPLRDGKRYIDDVCNLNFNEASDQQRLDAAWDLQWEDVIDPEEEYTIPEAIVFIARSRGWL
jgi:Fe-S-cluster containining protein